jgi:hypothetical protein
MEGNWLMCKICGLELNGGKTIMLFDRDEDNNKIPATGQEAHMPCYIAREKAAYIQRVSDGVVSIPSGVSSEE